MTAAVLRVQVSPGDKHDDRERELFHHDFTDQADADRYVEALGHLAPVVEHREHIDVVPAVPVAEWLTDEALRRCGVGSV